MLRECSTKSTSDTLFLVPLISLTNINKHSFTTLTPFRSFGEIYNEKKFVKSLDGIVRIAKYRPPQLSVEKLTAVRVPNRVSEAYIATNIEPLFKTKGNLSLETHFPSSTTMNAKEFEYFDSLSCLAMFGTLELQSELKQVVGLMVERLRALSRKSNGPFVAVDLRVEMLENKECRESNDFGKLWCYNAVEVGEFLKGIGFHRNTTIYLTQSGWTSLLDPLRQSYPKTYTKVLSSLFYYLYMALFLMSAQGHLLINHLIQNACCTI